ncbi:MAG: type VI secretion system tube protein Hcp [Nitrosospira sp.]
MAQGDMFLKIESGGPIKGETQDENHKDEIDVIDWSWGMQAKTALSGGGASPKATLNELSIVKQVDSASTGLMSAMRNNELIKKAVLTVRKAGGDPHEYFKITIEKGRITSLDVDTSSFVSSGYLSERLSLAFQKISVEYVPQGREGLPQGSMLFDAEIS